MEQNCKGNEIYEERLVGKIAKLKLFDYNRIPNPLTSRKGDQLYKLICINDWIKRGLYELFMVKELKFI